MFNDTKSSAVADKPPNACARRCCAINNCPVVNDCDLLTGFSDFYLPISHFTPSMRGIPSSYRVHIWYGTTRMTGLQSGEGHMMINSVVWAQYINMTVFIVFYFCQFLRADVSAHPFYFQSHTLAFHFQLQHVIYLFLVGLLIRVTRPACYVVVLLLLLLLLLLLWCLFSCSVQCHLLSILCTFVIKQINNDDDDEDLQTDTVAIAYAAPMHCDGRQ